MTDHFARPQPTLHGPRLALRPFAADDAPGVQALLADAAIAAGTLTIPHPYPDGAAAEWIGTHADGWGAGRLATWAVVDAATGELVGAVSLRITGAHRRAEAGFWIARAWWGRGVATEALRAVVAFGFETLALHRIAAHHFSGNPASGRVMRRVGLLHEGRVRGAVLRDGVPRDLELYGILHDDPRP